MKLDKVSIDLDILLDPYKLAIILSGLDKYYSEIFVPDGYKMLQVVYGPNFGTPFTYQPLNENFGKEAYEMHNYSLEKIEANNFIASFQLFKKAAEQGMISFLPSGLDYRMVLDYVGASDYFFHSDYNIHRNNYANLNISSDRGGILEELLYYDLTMNIKPIYGNMKFSSYLNNNFIVEDIRTYKNIEKNVDFESILRCPEGHSVDELFDFIKNLELIEKFNYFVENEKAIMTKNKDLSILFMEFGSTLTADTVIFKGFPVSSGALLVYHAYNRIKRGKRKE